MRVGKKRPLAHIVGSTGIDILRQHFPAEWVVREYGTDYGIDLCVELFAPYKDGFITVGEHIFFQVKSTKNISKVKLKVCERFNVEKSYSEDTTKFVEIDVVRFVVDTDLLALVEIMGSAIPVMLVVVDINTKDAFFICLNDYIEKILNPEGDYTKSKRKTLYIPIQNKINSDSGIKIIEWYAKRPKLYALFNKVNYQYRELQYTQGCEREAIIQHFLKIILRFDAWKAGEFFGPMYMVKKEIDYFIKHGITEDANSVIRYQIKKGEDVDEKTWEATFCEGTVSLREAQKTQGLFRLWDKLVLMGDTFEDVTRELFLPTSLGINANP